MAEPLNTGLSAQQVLTAFDRALNDYTDAEIDAMLGEKQDTITDISEIRSGAAAGETAVQQTAFETDQQRQETEIGAVANAGAKNSFDIQHPSTVRNTEYNATYDGGVELTCSNAAWTQYIISDISVESGSEYDFTLYVDAISGTDAFRAYVRDTNSSGNVLYDSGNISAATTISRTIASSSGKIWVGIYLNNSASDKTASAKIRGMLRPTSITDDTFVPYAMSNVELTKSVLNKQDILLYTNRTNADTYSFSGLINIPDNRRFKYGILIGGGAENNPEKAMMWYVFVNTSEAVFFTKIIGEGTQTLTGSISDGVLTITSSATIYGGLRLLWFG